jgi:YD repeat-containing protein
MSPFRRLSAPRVKFARLCLCLSLLTAQLMPTFGSAAVPSPRGFKPSLAQNTGAPAAGLPDMEEARRSNPRAPKAVAPVASKRRRCPPHDHRCNDDIDGKGRALPTPTPSAKPGHAQGAQEVGQPRGILASFARQSALAVLSAAMNGGHPFVNVPVAEYLSSGGGYAVSDTPSHPEGLPDPDHDAAPSALSQPPPYAVSAPYGAGPSAIPGTVEAEHFDQGGAGVAYQDTTPGSSGQDYDQPPSYPLPAFRQPTDVDIYKSASYGNNYLVLSHAGDWMNYAVDVAASGAYTLEARVAWGGANGTPGTFHVEMDGADVTGPLQIPDTNWSLTTVTKTGVQLTAGRHVMRVVADTNAGNGIMGDIDYFRFMKVQTAYNGQALSIPGKIEAEHFDIGAPEVAYHDTTGGNSGQDYTQPSNYPVPAFRQPTDVDIYRHVNYSGGYLILSHAGDWMKYTVDVDASGSYTLETRVTWGGAGGTPGTFHVEVDGVDKTGPLAIPDNNWVMTTITKAGLQLTSGRHVLRIVADTNAGNGVMGDIDYLRFTPSSEGAGQGLTADYYDNANFTNYRLTRTDSSVNFAWGAGEPAPSVGAEEFSVRWSGTVVPRYSQQYTFYTTTDDGVRLWVDGQLLIDRWVDQGPTEWSSVPVTLAAGRHYSIRMEFYDRSGGATAKLSWSSASQTKEIVPQSQLYSCWKGTGQFVEDFYQGVLSRQPFPGESGDWSNQLAQAQGETQLMLEARGLGRALFKSTEYAARGRTNQQYVEDLYRGYMQRQPDAGGVGYWAGVVQADPSNGRENVLAAFEGSPEFEEKVRRLCGTSASATDNGGDGYNFSTARLDPSNRTGGGGVDALSRNHNWTLPLVSLPGRAGLDLGLALTYNSLVWTKDATGVTFDADRGFPSPGFRLGFPVVQARFVNPQIQKANQPVRYSYLLVTPSGARAELRQKVGSPNVYESADSSYLQLTDYGGGALQLASTDGTRLTFFLTGGEHQCREVLDRNGNYLTVNYDALGQIANVVDTLGRVVTFNYDAFQNLLSITQPWKRETETGAVQETHAWATFGYRDLTLQPSFSNLGVLGMPSGTVIPALSQVGLSDGSYYKFEYNDWGQVYKVTRYAADSAVNGVAQDTHPLSYTLYDLPGSPLRPDSPQEDCPRFTEQRVWAEHGVMGQSAEATTAYSPWSANMTSCTITPPDATPGPENDEVVYEETYGADWQHGLTTASVVRVGGEVKKTAETLWEHDGAANDPSPTNPRVKETNVSDEQNHRRAEILYTSYGLPREVIEYKADAVSVLRRAQTDYRITPVADDAYLSRRIIGLVRERRVYSETGALVSKVSYQYDWGATASGLSHLQQQGSPVQHDSLNYGAGFRVGRGNVTSVLRWDVASPDTAALASESTTGYNTDGSIIFTRDSLGHQTTLAYGDKFWSATNQPSEINRNTFAYPTTVTDPDGFQSTSQYNFDMGVATSGRTPQPHSTVSQPEPAGRAFYDAAGRILKTKSDVNGAYTRWVYPPSIGYVQSFSAVSAGVESYSISVLDGAGRVRAAGGYLPPPGDTGTGNYTGTYTAQYFEYDVLGRQAGQSNPKEVDASWLPAGSDGGTQWVYTRQTFDWKGRPLVKTNADGTTVETAYGGCGCAGGEVIAVRDEVGRRLNLNHDVAGRLVKEEVLYPQPKAQPLSLTGSVYSTTVNTYNARDQVTSVRQYQGTEASGVYQETVIVYDGHGRLRSRRAPEQEVATTYAYNSDDTLAAVTDGRGAVAAYSYNNNRHLATLVSYSAPVNPPSPIPVPSPVSFEYDAAGNRKAMADDAGSVAYEYDALSRLTKETRQFSGLTGSYPLSYQYNLAGGLTSVADHTGAQVGYAYDRAGRVREVTGAGFGPVTQFASGIEYRAWGGLKKMTYGNGMRTSLSYDAMLRVEQFKVEAQNQPGGASTKMLKQYSYYADGLPGMADDGRADLFDRAFSYDHVGRLKEAYTGGEARAFLNQTPGGVADGPFRQSYGYNVWGDMTGRSNRFWSRSDTFGASYVNGRRHDPNWQYDLAGNVLNDTALLYIYDAAGHNRGVSDNSTVWVEQLHDGDGQAVRRVEERLDPNGQPAGTETTFYVRSAALGGRVVLELNGQGVKAKGKVYLGGELIAEQFAGVEWKHQEPVTGSRGESQADGSFETGAEFDPLGVDVGRFDPFLAAPTEPPATELPSLLRGPGVPSGRCTWDVIPILCDQAVALLGRGAAVVAPSQTTIPVIYKGQRVLATWQAYSDGYQGFVPVTARYTGSGIFAPLGGVGRPRLGRGRLTDTDFAGLNGVSGASEAHLGRRADVMFLGAGFSAAGSDTASLFNQARFSFCLKNLFSVNIKEVDSMPEPFSGQEVSRKGGLFSGMHGSKHIWVSTDMTTYNSSQIPVNLEAGKRAGGFVNKSHPQTGYVASDLAQKAPFDMVMAAWVHELGNSLRWITGLHPTAKNQNLREWDKDSGMALEECVYRGKVFEYANGTVGVTTNPQSLMR